jgi:hypothetical protein
MTTGCYLCGKRDCVLIYDYSRGCHLCEECYKHVNEKLKKMLTGVTRSGIVGNRKEEENGKQ